MSWIQHRYVDNTGWGNGGDGATTASGGVRREGQMTLMIAATQFFVELCGWAQPETLHGQTAGGCLYPAFSTGM
jgi:hypothetical protein